MAMTRFPMVAPWWFNGLILSYYLVFPLLFWALRKLGPTAFLALCLVLQMMFFKHPPSDFLKELFRSYRSDFIGCRLLEVAFGMCLAERVVRLGAGVMREWTSWPATIFLGALTGLSFSTLGMQQQPVTVEPVRAFLVFLTLYALFERLPAGVLRFCSRLAGASMMVYLIHMPLVDPVCDLFAGKFELELLYFVPFLAGCFLISVPLERMANALGRLMARPFAR